MNFIIPHDLHSSLFHSVRELSQFIQDTAAGLSAKVSGGDYAGLVNIMGHLMAIRDRQISNEQHFKPLKSTAELLKTYGQQLPDSVYTQLEVRKSATDGSCFVRLSEQSLFFASLPQNTGTA